MSFYSAERGKVVVVPPKVVFPEWTTAGPGRLHQSGAGEDCGLARGLELGSAAAVSCGGQCRAPLSLWLWEGNGEERRHYALVSCFALPAAWCAVSEP